ncbi:BZ3500_MvSof-1268-A1-R1_Chr5-2g07911 [Microbotryum saponariae]|uniref:BZ3500_MvSof-1268-A1-R1_Chr5-2g07911 protein n=1 Tax=Microbotryum saponariae TaxID=289078 RepID=A0A2X0L9T5_9BASI|nr:BZ3500_MvSof-1268-A1-R1_Chr5-2g07911 [Microbotryum saponariae]SDA05780.1 BZ3501_MvSof-1269-A2-R1_Chr5-2g07733 [Microbotryum saponariae]
MSSHVFYRFRSQKEPSRIAFDGTGISVWDLKKEIIMENKMGRGADFDFAIYNADTEEEYHDHQVVPRSTSVLARRLPPARPGRGNAQDYMISAEMGPASAASFSGYAGGGGGRGDMQKPRGGVQSGGGRGGWNASSFSKRFDGRDDAPSSNASAAPQEPAPIVLPSAAPADEANALAAMFAASSQQWQETQEQMASQTPVRRPPMMGANRPSQPRATPSGTTGPPGVGDRPRHDKFEQSKPPPPGYICYRCGQKGHWIQECPTNNDHAYDNRPKIKRTTGIPKSFLEAVEGPIDSATAEDLKASGVMVTAEGGFVVARPDQASWLAHRAITKNLSASDVQNLAPTDPDLTCPIDSKLLREAVLTPCCQTSFCRECVENALSDNDLLCPECETRIKSFEKLKPDSERRERVKKYIEDVVEASKEVEVKGEDKEKEEGKEGEDATVKQEEGEKEPETETTRAVSEVKETSTPTPNDTATAPTAAASTASDGGAVIPHQQQQKLQQQQHMLNQQILQFRQQIQVSQMQLQHAQAQMFQFSQTLQNPRAPPMVRMHAQNQMQQRQMYVMNMMQGMQGMQAMLQGLMARAAMGQGVNQGMNGMGMGMNAGAMPNNVPTGPRAQQQQHQQRMQNAPIPTEPKAMQDSVTAAGVKREAPEDFANESNGSEVKKVNTGSEEPSMGTNEEGTTAAAVVATASPEAPVRM